MRSSRPNLRQTLDSSAKLPVDSSPFRVISTCAASFLQGIVVEVSTEGSGVVEQRKPPLCLQQAGPPARADRHGGAPRQDRALPRTGLRDRGDLEDAARLLDEQGADPDQGQEAADL